MNLPMRKPSRSNIEGRVLWPSPCAGMTGQRGTKRGRLPRPAPVGGRNSVNFAELCLMYVARYCFHISLEMARGSVVRGPYQRG